MATATVRLANQADEALCRAREVQKQIEARKAVGGAGATSGK
ncbi:hypothetical protein BX265_8365 [Streptomyces sp. TLI_235]|nr:hypothetical protein [Streptomyces sp. TLI_235]PBC66300.1 hypothetical protein BX265_8365 [Streptomyces sp. TLI_235]